MLEDAVGSPEEFAKLFGITTLSDSSVISAGYPYLLNEVAKQMGLSSWNRLQPIIDCIRKTHGYDIKSGDNTYHYGIKAGTKTTTHKYSKVAVELFKKVLAGEDYTLDGIASA